MITSKQVAGLLGYAKGARAVRERLNRKDSFWKENIKHFEFGTHIQDLKIGVAGFDSYYETLISLGYTKQSIIQAENVYIFSQSGFLLFLKFAEGDKAVELYKAFIEDYFKTKAENNAMKKTLEEEKDFLLERKKFILGSMFMEQDESKRMEFFKENETISSRIKEIEVTLSKENLIEKVTPQLNIDETFTGSATSLYDLGS